MQAPAVNQVETKGRAGPPPLPKHLVVLDGGQVFGYALAIGSVGLAVLVKLLLDSFLVTQVPFLLFFSAVMLSTLLGGRTSGVLAMLLAMLAAAWFFLPPTATLLKPHWEPNLLLALFFLDCGFMCWLAHRLQQNQQALQDTESNLRVREDRLRWLNEQLEQHVAERTAELQQANAELRTEIAERRQTETALLETEARHQAVLASAGAVLTIDEYGVIESVNSAAEKMLGYTATELLGQTIGMIMPSPYREEHDTYLANYRRTGVRRIIGTEQELLVQPKNGPPFAVELMVTEVRLGNRKLFTGVLRDIRRRKVLEREVIEIGAREQQRLGQELHDGVGQQLTGLTLMAQTLVQRLEQATPPQRELAIRIADRLERAHADVRALAHGLVPVHLDTEGLRAALDDLAAVTREQAHIACTFHFDEPLPDSDGPTATNLFRIAQEAVSNALRHGQARTIRLTLHDTPTALVLSIRDDGVGIADLAAAGQGLGIRIMEHRAGVIGGALQVRSAPGGGTLISCTVPRRNHHDHD